MVARLLSRAQARRAELCDQEISRRAANPQPHDISGRIACSGVLRAARWCTTVTSHRAQGLADADHTTLLLNCYTKLKAQVCACARLSRCGFHAVYVCVRVCQEKLQRFIRGEKDGDAAAAASDLAASRHRAGAGALSAGAGSHAKVDVNFDVKNAIIVLRGAGFVTERNPPYDHCECNARLDCRCFEDALYLARQHGEHEWRVAAPYDASARALISTQVPAHTDRLLCKI